MRSIFCSIFLAFVFVMPLPAQAQQDSYWDEPTPFSKPKADVYSKMFNHKTPKEDRIILVKPSKPFELKNDWNSTRKGTNAPIVNTIQRQFETVR